MTTLVTGPTGKVGRHVLAELRATGQSARAASRTSELSLDWTRPSTGGPALRDVDRVFLVVPGGDDGHRSVSGLGDRVCEFIDVAESHGITRIVVMTALGMEHAPHEVEQRAVEVHLQDCELEWTVLRPNWFFQNLTEGPLRTLAVAGRGALRLPTGSAAVSFIDTRDIASCAVASLKGGHSSCAYSLTGPAALAFDEVAVGSTDSLLPVERYEPVSDAAFRRFATDLGWHPDYVETLAQLFATIASGANAEVSNDVERILGRPARTFHDFLSDLTP